MNCNKNCCTVGKILYRQLNDDMDNIIFNNYNELKHCEAFNQMYELEVNQTYALAYYCVHNGHLECLKEISKEPYFMYHGDLACYAVEENQLECLKFIVEELKNVYIPKEIDNVGQDCLDYVNELIANPPEIY